MSSRPTPPVGLVLGSVVASEELRQAAAAGERLGFGQLWMAEGCFTCGGVSGTAAVLGATSEIPVGMVIVNAMVRHPALLAMELATLARMYPDRLVPAIGLGLPDWLRQLGVYPSSPLSALAECVGSVRALLAGEEITSEGLSGSTAYSSASQSRYPSTWGSWDRGCSDSPARSPTEPSCRCQPARVCQLGS